MKDVGKLDWLFSKRNDCRVADNNSKVWRNVRASATQLRWTRG